MQYTFIYMHIFILGSPLSVVLEVAINTIIAINAINSIHAINAINDINGILRQGSCLYPITNTKLLEYIFIVISILCLYLICDLF